MTGHLRGLRGLGKDFGGVGRLCGGGSEALWGNSGVRREL